MEEAKYVRSSYNSAIEETRKLERYVLTLTGLTWSLCATNFGKPGFNILVWFPCFSCFVFGLRSGAMYYRSILIVEYLERIESKFELPIQYGFGNFQRNQLKGPHAIIAASAFLFWFLLQVVTIFVPILYNKVQA